MKKDLPAMQALLKVLKIRVNKSLIHLIVWIWPEMF